MNRTHADRVQKSKSMFSTPDSASEESESSEAEGQLKAAVQRLQREKEEWMQKYYSLLTAQEIKERLVAETLETVESEIRKLNTRVRDLQRENQQLRTEVEQLTAAQEEQQSRWAELHSRWNKDRDSWQQALEKERNECAGELADISSQFARIKRQFQRQLQDPRQAALLRKLRTLEGQNQRFRQDNLEMKRSLSALRKELRVRRQPSSRLSRSVPRHINASPDNSDDIEHMLARVETRLNRAKELAFY